MYSEHRAREDTEELIAYWTQVGRRSPHLHSQQPCITDAYCYRAVQRLLARYLDGVEQPHPLRVFKFDLYNEATWTQYSRYFFERGMAVYAIDICPEIIALARRRVAGWGRQSWLVPSQGDFRTLPFADDSFDVTFSYGSIEHVAQWRLALGEQVRVTRAGGTIIVGVPNLLNIWLKPFVQALCERLGLMDRYMNHEIHFPWWRIRAAVAALDVRDVQVHGVQILPKPLRFLDLFTEIYLAGRRHRRWACGVGTVKRVVLRPWLALFEMLERRDGWLNLLAGDTIVVKATKLETCEVSGG